jgi:hypothetical protein
LHASRFIACTLESSQLCTKMRIFVFKMAASSKHNYFQRARKYQNSSHTCNTLIRGRLQLGHGLEVEIVSVGCQTKAAFERRPVRVQIRFSLNRSKWKSLDEPAKHSYKLNTMLQHVTTEECQIFTW